MNEAAAILGVTVKTLQRWDKDNKVTFIRTPSGMRRLSQSELDRLLGNKKTSKKHKVLAIYARVSSHEQKKKGDLERQVQIIKEKIDSHQYQDIIVIDEVGSGLNDKRKGLLKIMKLANEGKITDLAVRYKDRLTRFGFEYLNQYFESHHVTVHVLDDKEEEQRSVQEELVEDLMAIIASFSGKLYGIRSHKNQMLKQKVKGAIEDVTNLPDEAEAGPDKR